MSVLRILLALFFVTILGYTIMVGADHGWNLMAIFFGDLAAMTWPGQFNLDFMTYLILSALWVAWRNNFSPASLGLALVASVGGMLFLAPYLLYLSIKTKGDIKALLIGETRI